MPGFSLVSVIMMPKRIMLPTSEEKLLKTSTRCLHVPYGWRGHISSSEVYLKESHIQGEDNVTNYSENYYVIYIGIIAK